MDATISLSETTEAAEVIKLYEANGWSSASKPEQLLAALKNSHSLVAARIEGKLVRLGNAISDGGALDFYRSLGFERAGRTEPTWIYDGDDH